MRDERALSWVAGCAYTGALVHSGWAVTTDLPPLPEAEMFPEGTIP
ncbi:MAG: hypothetical protein WC093_10585 [Methanoculleus sp.]